MDPNDPITVICLATVLVALVLCVTIFITKILPPITGGPPGLPAPKPNLLKERFLKGEWPLKRGYVLNASPRRCSRCRILPRPKAQFCHRCGSPVEVDYPRVGDECPETGLYVSSVSYTPTPDGKVNAEVWYRWEKEVPDKPPPSSSSSWFDVFGF